MMISGEKNNQPLFFFCGDRARSGVKGKGGGTFLTTVLQETTFLTVLHLTCHDYALFL